MPTSIRSAAQKFAQLVTGVKNRRSNPAELELDDTALLETIFGTLHENVFKTSGRILKLIKAAPRAEDLSAFGPFLGRSLLELGLTSTLGRLDPLRLVALAKYQQNAAAYDLGERNLLAVQWTGDLLTRRGRGNDQTENEAEPPAVKKVDWAKNHGPDKINRSLLGGHLGEFALKAAYANLQRAQVPEELLPPLLRNVANGESLIGHFASQADKLFSMWSKGTHAELLMPRENYFDSDTVVDNLIKTLDLVASLGALCHSAPICAPRLRDADRLDACQIVTATIEDL